jgi:MOSC domain-containing protein YiiM
VRTSIFKTPNEGRLRVTALNVEGDEQSDLSVHGGLEKAVYAYPSEHYGYWRVKLQGAEPRVDGGLKITGPSPRREGLT